ncbi:arylsulfatase [Bradyrhizobium cenepequi]
MSTDGKKTDTDQVSSNSSEGTSNRSKISRRNILLAGTSLAAASALGSAHAQTPIEGRDVLPIPEAHIKPPLAFDARQAKAPAIKPLRPPEGAPNVIIVLVDDMGFGASSAFGGPCNMPTAERLAADGLKYTRFHTTAVCSASRAAFLAGRNHHTLNMGAITEQATSMPGYTSVRPDSCATLAQMLKLNGYNTAAVGKYHQTPVWETSISGSFDRWPTGEGFEHFYGFIGAESNQWNPTPYAGNWPVEPPDDPDYHFSADITDKAIAFIRDQRAMTPDKPFFLYLSFGATHDPHHAPKEWIDKYRGKFDLGWDRQREQTFARQKQLGVVPQDARLTTRPESIPAWDSLSADDKRVAARLMEAYAGYAEHTDAQVARLIDALRGLGVLDNTLLFYNLGDNGASAEGGLSGAFNWVAQANGVEQKTADILPHLDEIGGPTAYNHYPVGWAHAMDTPYQWTKQIASHWGGTRNGMIVHWPAGFKTKGEVRNQFCHCIDIVPTILQAAKLPHPDFVNGIQQHPIEGTSFAYTFDDPKAAERHTTQYFEMFGNRAIYHDGWMACARHAIPWKTAGAKPPLADDVWELYAPGDWTQADDIAAKNPQKLWELQQLFTIEAAKYNVFPLDDRVAERLNSDLAGRPDLLAGKTSMTLYPGMTHLNENTVPNIKNKSYKVIAEIEVPKEAVTVGAAGRGNSVSGAIVAQGGRFAGWSLYMKDGVPVHCYNWFDMQRTYVRGTQPLPPGKHTLRYEFAYDGGGVGKGGTGTLFVDDRQVDQKRVEKTVPFVFSGDDFMDIGNDTGAPVVEDYGTPKGRFTGKINWVRIDIGSEKHEDAEGKQKALLGRS